MLKLFIYFLLFILVPFNYFSQVNLFDIAVGSNNSHDGILDDILYKRNGDIIYIKQKGNVFQALKNEYKYTLFYTSNGEVKNVKMYEVSKDNSKLHFQKALLLNDQLYIVSTEELDNQISVYIQKFNSQFESEGEIKLIDTFQDPSGLISKNQVRIIKSKNTNFFAVVCELHDDKSKRLGYNYSVHDSTTNLINKGFHQLDVDIDYLRVNQHYISDSGVLFTSIINYKRSLSRKVDNLAKKYVKVTSFGLMPDAGLSQLDHSQELSQVESVYLIQNLGEEEKVFKYSPGNVILNRHKIVSNDANVLSLVGTFQKTFDQKIIVKSKVKMHGFFHIQINFNDLKITKSNFNDLTKELLVQGKSEKEKTKLLAKYALSSGKLSLTDYLLKNVFISEQTGQIYGMLEETKVYKHSSSNTGVSTSPTNSFGVTNFTGSTNVNTSRHESATTITKDLIVFSINKEGNFQWFSKIPKKQNIAPIFRDTYFDEVKGNLTILFNDNIKNYENGQFIYGKKCKKTPGSIKKNVLAKVEFSGSEGKYTRKILLENKNIDGRFAPHYIGFNVQKNKFIGLTVKGILDKYVKVFEVK